MSFDITDPTKPTIVKDPDAVLDYTINLSSWLVGETITSITVKSVGVIVDSSSIVTGNKVVLWVSGGYTNSPASVTVRFTTSAGRTDDRTLFFTIKHR